MFRKPKPVKHSGRHSSDHGRRTEGSTSSGHERRGKEEEKSKKVPHSGKSASKTPKRHSTDGARSERRNERKTHKSSREEARPAQESAKAAETPKKRTTDSGVEKPRSDKRGGTTRARSSERGTESPATIKAQKSEREAPARTKEGGKKESSTPTAVAGHDNWELQRMRAREASRSANTTSVGNAPGPQGVNDKQKATGKSTNKPIVPKTEKMRIYTGQLKKETNENFKLQYRIGDGSVAVLSSETLRDNRRQMYGPGKTKFADDEWKDGKLRLYTTDPGNVLVLVPKDPKQQPRIQPVLPPKLDSEDFRTWKCSATFNKDVFHVVEISRETFLQEIFNKPNDEAEETLLKNK